jgi:hypothetical protein
VSLPSTIKEYSYAFTLPFIFVIWTIECINTCYHHKCGEVVESIHYLKNGKVENNLIDIFLVKMAK